MENNVSTNSKNPMYMSENNFFNGEYFITFNILSVNSDCQQITVAVTDNGRISVQDFPLIADKNENFYFEYGVAGMDRIYLNEFEEV